MKYFNLIFSLVVRKRHAEHKCPQLHVSSGCQSTCLVWQNILHVFCMFFTISTVVFPSSVFPWHFILYMYVIYIVHILTCISPFTPGDFAKNHALDTIILLRAKSYHKAVYSSRVHFTAFWSRCKTLGCKVRACAESKILRFYFSPLFLLFFPHFFFSCWAFSRLHFGGKGF